jgi:hypothetical protein
MADRLGELHVLKQQLDAIRRAAEMELLRGGGVPPLGVSGAENHGHPPHPYAEPSRSGHATGQTSAPYSGAPAARRASLDGANVTINFDDLSSASTAAGLGVIGGIASTSVTTNSRAVLAALRALQDKIRRLEADRAKLEADNARLRSELATAHEQHQRGAADSASRSQSEVQGLHVLIDQLRNELVVARSAAESARRDAEEAVRAEVSALHAALDGARAERAEAGARLAAREEEARVRGTYPFACSYALVCTAACSVSGVYQGGHERMVAACAEVDYRTQHALPPPPPTPNCRRT